jgi:hypothetical protein
MTAYLDRFFGSHPVPSATVRLLLAKNPDATYFSYLNELGAAGLLPELPADGKVWAAPGYELLGGVIEKLIRHAGPFLDDEAVPGGLALRSGVEAFGKQFDAAFSCAQAPLPAGDGAEKPERTEFTRFRNCDEALEKLVGNAKDAETRAAGARWSSELLSFLDQKAGNAKLGTSTFYSEEPPASSSARKRKSLKERIETFAEFTDPDRGAAEDGITALIQQIGKSVSQDGNDRADQEISEKFVVELADPFAILRLVRLHYFDAPVPQIDPNEQNPASLVDLWSGTGATLNFTSPTSLASQTLPGP